MATLLDYVGITKLRDAWPKWKANVIAVNNQVIGHVTGTADKHSTSHITNDSMEAGATTADAINANKTKVAAHVGGTADKHAAQSITYSGSFTSKENVKDALDQAKAEINTIVVNASVDPEVALARESSVKSETFATLGARLEESEQDLVTHEAGNTQKFLQLKRVNIMDYGAVGDGVTNDYQAFIDACAASGSNGIIFFPETTTSVYYMSNGQIGTAGRISMVGRPYFDFANPEITLLYNYDPNLKYVKNINPFKISYGGITRDVFDSVYYKQYYKALNLAKQPSQTLTKIDFTSDVTPQNFNGTIFANITGLAALTASSMEFDKEASGTNLLMHTLASGKTLEMLFEKDGSAPSGGFYAICIETDIHAYLIEFNALTPWDFDVIKHLKGVGTTVNIDVDLTLPTQYQLKNSTSVLYSVKNVDDIRFEFYVNGYLAYRLTLGDYGAETYSKVGMGHARHLNNMVTISYGLEITNYNNPKYDDYTYFAFGDSITFGAYSFVDYPSIVSDMLFREWQIKTVAPTNLGVSGDSSSGCLVVVNANLASITDTSIVSVMIGTNDCIGAVNIETYIANVSDIIDAILTKTSLLVIASFPVYATTIANYANIALYNSRLKQLCIDKGVKFVDNMASFGHNEDLYHDGIHPQAGGQLILAKGFADAIYEMVNA